MYLNLLYLNWNLLCLRWKFFFSHICMENGFLNIDIIILYFWASRINILQYFFKQTINKVQWKRHSWHRLVMLCVVISRLHALKHLKYSIAKKIFIPVSRLDWYRILFQIWSLRLGYSSNATEYDKTQSKALLWLKKLWR